MPYLHCETCHHEWEGEVDSQCDWCGCGNYILEEKTPLEKVIMRLTKRDEDDAPCAACEIESVTNDDYGREHTCERRRG